MQVKRGEIWFADLGSAFGSEQGGDRPVLIIQNDVGNAHSPTTIVAPLTAARKKPLPTHVRLRSYWGKAIRGTVMLEQVRVIDKKRLIDLVGAVSHKEMGYVDRALRISVGVGGGRYGA